jgi:predicted transcriptional regulator
MPKKPEPQTAEPKLAQVTALVPLSVRERVDALAHKERVSRSEIGRRAVVDYVKRQQAGES